MIYYSNGGFTHTDVYDMPVYLRNFYYTKLIDTKKEETKQAEKIKNKSQPKGIGRPGITR